MSDDVPLAPGPPRDGFTVPGPDRPGGPGPEPAAPIPVGGFGVLIVWHVVVAVVVAGLVFLLPDTSHMPPQCPDADYVCDPSTPRSIGVSLVLTMLPWLLVLSGLIGGLALTRLPRRGRPGWITGTQAAAIGLAPVSVIGLLIVVFAIGST